MLKRNGISGLWSGWSHGGRELDEGRAVHADCSVLEASAADGRYGQSHLRAVFLQEQSIVGSKYRGEQFLQVDSEERQIVRRVGQVRLGLGRHPLGQHVVPDLHLHSCDEAGSLLIFGVPVPSAHPVLEASDLGFKGDGERRSLGPSHES